MRLTSGVSKQERENERAKSNRASAKDALESDSLPIQPNAENKYEKISRIRNKDL